MSATAMSQTPKRYTITCGNQGYRDDCDCQLEVEVSPDGEWVKWEDIAHLFDHRHEGDARANAEAIALLRAWVAGCGDQAYSTKDECRELLQRSGEFLASINTASNGGA